MLICQLLLASLGVSAATAVAEQAPDPFETALELQRNGDAQGARAQMLRLARANDPRAQDVLAAMMLKGIGGEASVPQAMGWYCMLAHHPAGGRAVVNALWFLAEFHRTGGGVPGHGYTAGVPARENPVKALFWFRIMALQERFYDRVLPEGIRLGRIGAGVVNRQLLAGERQRVERDVSDWSAARTPASTRDCLALP